MSINELFFEPDKLGSLLSGYHPRPTQIKAAELIDDALYNYKNIVIEAPTGSGKTLSYLVPVFSQGKRTIISTKTKQLMQQLYLKDIPVMNALFGDRKVAVLKGRKNYFCPHRFLRWIYPNSVYYKDVIEWYAMQQEELIELPRGLFDWSILDKMSADSQQCLYNKCKYFTSCPFYAAKDAANSASVVITNHYMLLTDIAMKADESFGAIFDPTDHIVFDEAHSIADIYSVYAGVEIPLRRLAAPLVDYKEKLPFEKLNQLLGLHKNIAMSIKDGKKPYSRVKEDVYPFMDLCRELVKITEDNDLKDEFTRWEQAFAMVDGDDEGLRYAEQRGNDVLLKFIPMNVGCNFMQGLTKAALSSVFISATLSANGSFDYFLRETGLDQSAVTTVMLPPVFEMKLQAKLYVPKVRQNQRDGLMTELITAIDGSVLVICNSTKRMQELIDYFSVTQPKVVFSQNDGDWSTFTANENIVLVGCATLREGIDLAGGDFKCVIIDKLPFEYPHDLYLSRKAELVEKEVGNSFANFNLPRAVLYFKQAAGRLIRHESDKGLLAVFDDRILTKSYGGAFLNVLQNVTVTDCFSEAVSFLR